MMLALLLSGSAPQFADSATVQTGTNSVARFFTLLLIFVIVCAICYFTTKFVAGKEKNKMGSKNMQVLETTRLAPNKYIGLVKIGEKYVAVAYGKDSISMLCEVPKEELSLQAETDSKGSFSDIFKKVAKKGTQTEEPVKKLRLADRAALGKQYENDEIEEDTPSCEDLEDKNE